MQQQKPVTGAWQQIVALIQGVVAAGLARIEERMRPDGSRDALTCVLGDDRAIRALYAAADPERQRLRALGAYRAADETLCRTQRQAYAMGERSLTLAVNIYGWAVHDVMSSNIAGGRAAQTERGATLEGCIRYAVQASARAGTTLSIDPAILVREGACDWSDAASLAALCGATDEQQAWLLATPEREAQAREEAHRRIAERAARKVAP